MSTSFNGKVGVITGAGEGIGYAIAAQLAAEGTRVVINDIDADRAADAARAIRKEGGTCMPLPGDVGKGEVVKELVNQAVEEYGRLDLAIANAGITIWNNFLDYRPEDFHKVLAVNLGGSFFLAQAAAKKMIAQKRGGRILLMSSVTGHRAMPYLSAYSMTKAGIEGLARNLVAELSPHGITINVIAPGATVTPRNLVDDPNYEAVWAGITPTGKSSRPTDIAEAALFLLSPGASQITGQTLIIDGGWSAVSPTPALDFVEAKDTLKKEE